MGNSNSNSVSSSNSDKLKVGKPVIEESRLVVFRMEEILDLLMFFNSFEDFSFSCGEFNQIEVGQ